MKLLTTSSLSMFANFVCADRVLDSLLLFLAWPAERIGFLYVFITLTSFIPLLISPVVSRLGKLRILQGTFALTVVPVAVMAVASLLGPETLSAWVFPMVLLFWVSSFAMNASWWSVSQDVTDEDNRGNFLGWLRMSWSTVHLVLSIFGAIWLNVSEDARLERFTWLFVIATVGSIARAVIIWNIPTVENSTEMIGPKRMIHGSLRLLSQDKSLRRLVLLSILLGFAGGATTPFYGVFFKFSLGMATTTVAFSQVFFALGGPVSHLFWGFAADRFGNRPLFRLSATGGAVVSIAMAILGSASGIQAAILFVTCMLMASILAAHNMAYTRAVLNASEAKYTPFVMPFTGVISSMAVLAATTICSTLLGIQAVKEWHVPIWFTHMDIYKVFLLAAAACYLAVLVASRGLPEKHSYSAADVLGPLWARPLRVLWHMYQARMPLTEDERTRLTRRLGHSESPLAENTLIKALFDPSLEVRMTAVSALATMEPTHKVVAALISAARTRGLGISPEAIHTLGLIRAHDSAAFLAEESLKIHSYMVRGHAVRALARLNDLRALDRMYEMLCAPDEHIFVRMSCAWALSRLNFVEAADDMYAFYLQSSPGPLRRELLIDMGNLIGKPQLYYTLRLSVEQGAGEFCRWLKHLHQKKSIDRQQYRRLLSLLRLIEEGEYVQAHEGLRLDRSQVVLPAGDSVANRLLETLLNVDAPNIDDTCLALYLFAWRLSNMSK